ncbi:hypothetical protein CYMTET_50905 [Cymbomonas tetramitiformis]|uniref:Uncharacterized protein n=1 Tax=Cymbomonas tetramitiformis TaxID=36881 RepID=A0AAE0BNB7_9CHLO|nr:hypothetical protein CYMTET_50905 [Cymbomonas tetramitiformis]
MENPDIDKVASTSPGRGFQAADEHDVFDPGETLSCREENASVTISGHGVAFSTGCLMDLNEDPVDDEISLEDGKQSAEEREESLGGEIVKVKNKDIQRNPILVGTAQFIDLCSGSEGDEPEQLAKDVRMNLYEEQPDVVQQFQEQQKQKQLQAEEQEQLLIEYQQQQRHQEMQLHHQELERVYQFQQQQRQRDEQEQQGLVYQYHHQQQQQQEDWWKHQTPLYDQDASQIVPNLEVQEVQEAEEVRHSTQVQDWEVQLQEQKEQQARHALHLQQVQTVTHGERHEDITPPRPTLLELQHVQQQQTTVTAEQREELRREADMRREHMKRQRSRQQQYLACQGALEDLKEKCMREAVETKVVKDHMRYLEQQIEQLHEQCRESGAPQLLPSKPEIVMLAPREEREVQAEDVSEQQAVMANMLCPADALHPTRDDIDDVNLEIGLHPIVPMSNSSGNGSFIQEIINKRHMEKLAAQRQRALPKRTPVQLKAKQLSRSMNRRTVGLNLDACDPVLTPVQKAQERPRSRKRSHESSNMDLPEAQVFNGVVRSANANMASIAPADTAANDKGITASRGRSRKKRGQKMLHLAPPVTQSSQQLFGETDGDWQKRREDPYGIPLQISNTLHSHEAGRPFERPATQKLGGDQKRQRQNGSRPPITSANVDDILTSAGGFSARETDPAGISRRSRKGKKSSRSKQTTKNNLSSGRHGGQKVKSVNDLMHSAGNAFMEKTTYDHDHPLDNSTPASQFGDHAVVDETGSPDKACLDQIYGKNDTEAQDAWHKTGKDEDMSALHVLCEASLTESPPLAEMSPSLGDDETSKRPIPDYVLDHDYSPFNGSTYHGVTWDDHKVMWHAYFCHSGHCGMDHFYKVEKHAAQAHDVAAVISLGHSATTNFPVEEYAWLLSGEQLLLDTSSSQDDESEGTRKTVMLMTALLNALPHITQRPQAAEELLGNLWEQIGKAGSVNEAVQATLRLHNVLEPLLCPQWKMTQQADWKAACMQLLSAGGTTIGNDHAEEAVSDGTRSSRRRKQSKPKRDAQNSLESLVESLQRAIDFSGNGVTSKPLQRVEPSKPILPSQSIQEGDSDIGTNAWEAGECSATHSSVDVEENSPSQSESAPAPAAPAPAAAPKKLSVSNFLFNNLGKRSRPACGTTLEVLLTVLHRVFRSAHARDIITLHQVIQMGRLAISMLSTPEAGCDGLKLGSMKPNAPTIHLRDFLARIMNGDTLERPAPSIELMTSQTVEDEPVVY